MKKEEINQQKGLFPQIKGLGTKERHMETMLHVNIRIYYLNIFTNLAVFERYCTNRLLIT